MRVYNTQPITAQTLAASFNSPVEQLLNMYGYSVQINVVGTVNGTFKLQASSDPCGPNAPAPTHFSDITSSSITMTTAGTYMWNVDAVYYNWMRLVFTDASGGTSTGTVTMVLNCKGI